MMEHMHERPMISVLMSAYNEEDWVEEAIDSILKQTYEDFEFIIVNDGSTDDTAEILASYEKRDNRITVINQENKGLTKSLNKGLKHCSGKYVARMDANDIALPTRFEKQASFLEEHPDHAVIGTWREEFWENQDKKRSVHFPTRNQIIQRTLVKYCCLGHSTTMMRTSVLKDLQYNESYDLGEDYDLWTRIGESHKLANLPDDLMLIRRIPGSITTSKNKWKNFKYQMRIKLNAWLRLQTRWWDIIHIVRPIIVLLLPSKLVDVYVDWKTQGRRNTKTDSD